MAQSPCLSNVKANGDHSQQKGIIERADSSVEAIGSLKNNGHNALQWALQNTNANDSIRQSSCMHQMDDGSGINQTNTLLLSEQNIDDQDQFMIENRIPQVIWYNRNTFLDYISYRMHMLAHL